MKKKVFLVQFLFLVLLVSCSKKESIEKQQLEESTVEVSIQSEDITNKSSSNIQSVNNESVQNNKNDKEDGKNYLRSKQKKDYNGAESIIIDYPKESLQEKFHADAHTKYLDAEMKFKELDDGGVEGNKTYLVRGINCFFYSPDAFEKKVTESGEERFLFKEDAKGEEIPLGTILTVLGDNKTMLKSGGPEWYEEQYGYFYINDAYNYFYETKWNGQNGYVFGAYIEKKDALTNKINSLFYKTNCKFENFYPIYNGNYLPETEQEALEKNKLAIEKLPAEERIYCDDLLDEYYVSRTDSMFVTTDLAAHVQHKFFDDQLQKIEEDYFIPRLLTITEDFIKVLTERNDIPKDIKQYAIKYFQVPEAILRSVPRKYQEDGDNWGEIEIKYEDVDVEEFISEYPEDVQADYKQVMKASGKRTAIFDTTEDFSQYKPRGHYTKNKALETYFKAQMWYGRIHFSIAEERLNFNAPKETDKMQPVAMAIVDTVHKNPELYDQWKELFDPITELIGLSDDLGFEEILPLWKDQKVEDFTSWVTDKEKLEAFKDLCHQKLRPPAIIGNSTKFGPAEEDKEGNIKPPMGWRFLGQRFTYDSDIHQKSIIYDPIEQKVLRGFVRGLDIMKVFGSEAADSLLAEQKDYDDAYLGLNDYCGGTEFQTKINNLQKEFASKDESFWTKTYYNSVLAQVKTQATFEQGTGFYFTESPAWNTKALISAHSTWAELRHDTILYVKQSYCAAEKSGDSDLEPTYLYEPIPEPINYIEPNLPFWEYSLASIQTLYNCLADFNLIDAKSDTRMKLLIQIYKHALDIVKLEVEDKPVDIKDNRWIKTIPLQLKNVISEYIDNPYAFFQADDSKKMACIADVFTNAEFGVCLEVGVGKPYRIYVPLNDGQGGKRIAIGYIPSYYEFYHGMNDRMTDEQWKEIVYKKDVDMTEYEPFWEQGCYLPEN